MRLANGPRILIGLMLMALTACINLSPSQSPETVFYLLHATITEKSATMVSASQDVRSLIIGPVDVAEYLKRPQLVTRPTASELRVDEFRLWAEPMPDAIGRVLQENLSALTGIDRIHTYPTRQTITPDLRIFLNVTRFEADGAGEVTLSAAWRIIRPSTNQMLADAHTIIVQPSVGAETSNLVAAMSMALAKLTRAIGDTLVESAASTDIVSN